MSMDIQENLTKVPLSEKAILHQSGVSFFAYLQHIDKMPDGLNTMLNEVSTPMRCIAPMDVVSKEELRSENTH